MNTRDEEIRDALTNRLTQANIDARSVAVEVVDGSAIVKGAVPTEEQRQRLAAILADPAHDYSILECQVQIVPVAPIDSADGRGRSPITGTSADSAHESRHQFDRT